ncbi:GNAT family N-acetyltransferase [Streptomyces sp. WZ-12]|uniref:GNAT family N-acetyltransferase n=1 Tax=Streptomyces sp. WZ-12 TaxID=3030210 RepID=UPI0023812689|nr:GNAT family N-acetyltransferase [Streptomyces sp. WZ-12]
MPMNRDTTNARDTSPRIRPLTTDDWDAITALESRAYAALGLSEEPAALASRAHASPDTCFALDLHRRLAGYLLALPYPAFHYPDLTRPERPSPPSRNLHLHDLVIAEPLRRRGLARHLLHHLTTTATRDGYQQISLIAVAGSEPFWAANGFHSHPGVVSPDEYGPHAVYMSRPLPTPAAPHHQRVNACDDNRSGHKANLREGA